MVSSLKKDAHSHPQQLLHVVTVWLNRYIYCDKNVHLHINGCGYVKQCSIGLETLRTNVMACQIRLATPTAAHPFCQGRLWAFAGWLPCWGSLPGHSLKCRLALWKAQATATVKPQHIWHFVLHFSRLVSSLTTIDNDVNSCSNPHSLETLWSVLLLVWMLMIHCRWKSTYISVMTQI